MGSGSSCSGSSSSSSGGGSWAFEFAHIKKNVAAPNVIYLVVSISCAHIPHIEI